MMMMHMVDAINAGHLSDASKVRYPGWAGEVRYSNYILYLEYSTKTWWWWWAGLEFSNYCRVNHPPGGPTNPPPPQLTLPGPNVLSFR